MPKLLREYRKKYPYVEIRVQTEDCNELLGLIRKNTIDVAMALSNKIDQTDMDSKILFDEKMIVVASPLHALAQKKNIEPKDLSGQCLIISPEGCGYRPLILAMLQQYAIKPSAVMEISSASARKECAIIGLGITILPQIIAKNDLLQGTLLQLDWRGPSFDVKTHIIWHKEKWLSPTIKVFLELCNAMRNN